VVPVHRKCVNGGEYEVSEDQGGGGGFSRKNVAKVVAEGGRLRPAEVLRCRVRHFSDGVVLGSREFVNEVLRKHREEFGVKRRTGAREMKKGEWSGLCTMRDLRLQAVSLS